MRHSTIAVLVGTLLCTGGYSTRVQADSKPKHHHESKQSRTVVVQPRRVSTTQPWRIKGHPISDKLSPIIERTNNRFQQALLYKPNERTTTEEQRQFATLLVQETPGRGVPVPDDLRIGAVVTDAAGQTVVDTQRPTVYTADSHVFIGDVYYQQRVHLWAYPGPEGKGAIWRGVRTTYGTNKHPLFWEILASKGQPTVLYVCTTIDEAAKKEFGKPMAGRVSAAEQPLSQQPDVVVARILPPGAQPGGPMVYLDSSDKAIDTLLCRCMPQQASEYVETAYYEMLPLDILGDVQIAADGPFRLLKTYTPQLSTGGQPWLEQVLNMPKKF